MGLFSAAPSHVGFTDFISFHLWLTASFTMIENTFGGERQAERIEKEKKKKKDCISWK